MFDLNKSWTFHLLDKVLDGLVLEERIVYENIVPLIEKENVLLTIFSLEICQNKWQDLKKKGMVTGDVVDGYFINENCFSKQICQNHLVEVPKMLLHLKNLCMFFI